jgi:hypothetical protein
MMPAKTLKKIQNHPAASWVGNLVTLDYLGQEEIQQEIHFDHPSVGQCGILIRRQTGLGTVKVISFSLPDKVEWNRCAQRADDVQNFDPYDMLVAMWEEFQNSRSEPQAVYGLSLSNVTTIGTVIV